MNPRSLFFFAVALTIAAASPASESSPRIAYAATQSGPGASLAESIHVGTLRSEVIAQIGLPGSQLSPDIWVYWKYRCDDPTAIRHGYDTLIITFATGHVADMKLVNAQTFAAAVARRSDGRVAVNAPSAR